MKYYEDGFEENTVTDTEEAIGLIRNFVKEYEKISHETPRGQVSQRDQDQNLIEALYIQCNLNIELLKRIKELERTTGIDRRPPGYFVLRDMMEEELRKVWHKDNSGVGKSDGSYNQGRSLGKLIEDAYEEKEKVEKIIKEAKDG